MAAEAILLENKNRGHFPRFALDVFKMSLKYLRKMFLKNIFLLKLPLVFNKCGVLFLFKLKK